MSVAKWRSSGEFQPHTPHPTASQPRLSALEKWHPSDIQVAVYLVATIQARCMGHRTSHCCGTKYIVFPGMISNLGFVGIRHRRFASARVGAMQPHLEQCPFETGNQDSCPCGLWLPVDEKRVLRCFIPKSALSEKKKGWGDISSMGRAKRRGRGHTKLIAQHSTATAWNYNTLWLDASLSSQSGAGIKEFGQLQANGSSFWWCIST